MFCPKTLETFLKKRSHYFNALYINGSSCTYRYDKKGKVKTLYSDILYNSKILYNVNCICTNVPVQPEFEFVTTEIQFNVKLSGDKQCRCKEG